MQWDARAAARRMDEAFLEEQREWTVPDAYVRVWDNRMQEVGVAGDYLFEQHSFRRNKVGAFAMTLPHDTPLRDHFFNNPDGEDAMIPITVDTKGARWSGKVDRVALVRDENGVETIEVSALDDLNHLSTTCLWASPWAPLYAQFPRHDIRIGPACSVMGNGWLGQNLARQERMNSFESFPIVVVPTNVLTDTSQWIGGSARFDMAFPFFDQFLKNTGVVVRAEMFLPEEDEQPAPEYFWLEEPTIVIRFEDESNVTGPTGTLLDGLVSWIEDLLDDGTTPVRYPNFDSEAEYEAVYQAGFLGTKREWPWVWYHKSEFDGLGESEIALHKPMATHVYVGGRSPSYVNAAIEIAIKNLLSWLGTLIGIPGLDALYRGQLDDVFFAFDVGVNRGRVQRAGPYAWRDHFVSGSEKAFTIDGQMAKLQGLHDTRGYTSHRVTVIDCQPYIFGLHYKVGQQIGFNLDSLIFADYVEEAVHTDDRQSGGRFELTIGDGADEEDPTVKGWNRLGQIAQVISVLAKDVGMEADFFGLF